MYKYCMLTTPTYGLDVLRLALHVCMYMSYGPAKQAAVSGGAVCPAGRFLSPRSDGLFQAGRHRPHAHRPPRRGPRDRQPRLLHGQRLRLLDERLGKYTCTRVYCASWMSGSVSTRVLAFWMSGSVSTCVLVFDCTKEIYLS